MLDSSHRSSVQQMVPEESSIPNQIPVTPTPTPAPSQTPAASQTPPAPTQLKPDRLQSLQQERNRSMSDPAAPKFEPKAPVRNPSSSISTPAPTNGPAVPKDNGAPSQPNKDSKDANQRPSALTSVIYPVLSKLLKSNQDEAVIAALAQLKIAFDNAEKAKPGITHSLIAQIIETLKR